MTMQITSFVSLQRPCICFWAMLNEGVKAWELVNGRMIIKKKERKEKKSACNSDKPISDYLFRVFVILVVTRPMGDTGRSSAHRDIYLCVTTASCGEGVGDGGRGWRKREK